MLYSQGEIVKCVENPFSEKGFWVGDLYTVTGAMFFGEDTKLDLVFGFKDNTGDIYYTANNLFERIEPMVSKDEDMVNHPSHYTSGGIETIDVIKAKLTEEEYIGFLKGTIIKYALRAGKKWDELEDFKKERWYLERLINFLEEEKEI